jgi:hypothetical protein
MQTYPANITRTAGIASRVLFTHTDELPQAAEDNVNRASCGSSCHNFSSFYFLIFTAITNSNLALGIFFSHYNKRKVKQVKVMTVNENKVKYFLRMCHQ